MSPSDRSIAQIVKPLRRGLATLRARVRGLTLLLGSSRLLIGVGAALVLLFLADYFLHLPLAVRTILLISLLGAGVYGAVRWIFGPLARPLGDDSLAVRVEEAYPELEDRLASSIAFARAEQDPENVDSRVLMRVVAEQTTELARDMGFSRVARSGPAWRAAGLALLLATGMGTAASAEPGLLGTFVDRNLLLRERAWPRRTTLVVEGMEPGQPVAVTRDREIQIRVLSRGWTPDSVVFTYWEKNLGPDASETVELASTAEDRSRFLIDLRVASTIQFTITGGDDERALVYEIEALTPPSVRKVTMHCAFPEYLGWEDRTLEGGDQRLPIGTEVAVRIELSEPAASARVSMGREAPADMKREDGLAFTFQTKVAQDVRYALHLEGARGETNDPAQDTFWIRALRDQRPGLRIHAPTAHVDRTNRGMLALLFEARDDHRLDSVVLRYSINESKERSLALGAEPGKDIRLTAGPGSTTARSRVVGILDFGKLRDDDGNPLQEGQEVEYRIVLKDSAGQVVESAKRSVELVNENEIARWIENRQGSLATTIERTKVDVDKTSEALETAERLAAGGELTDELRAVAGHARATASRVRRKTSNLARQLADLVNGYAFNRLDDEAALDQMLPYFESHLLKEPENPGPAYRGDLYRTLWQAVQEKAIRIGGGVRKLVQMAAVADVLARDEAAGTAAAIDAYVRTDDRAKAALSLREARERHQRVVEGLTLLERLAREWRTYETVQRGFKELKRLQQEVQRKIEEPRKER